MSETTEVKELEGFGPWLESVMADWKVPAAGVAVVKDGKVLLATSYGMRDVENRIPATGDTLYAIGSSSKAFTTMVMGILVDEKKLEWDKPVREYIPWFKLQDPYATERMTPRDLVCHRSGLPRHDFLWLAMFPTASRREVVERLRYLEPNKDFRTLWQYQNLMFLTAGYLCEVVTGKTWEALVQDKIFDPLGMKTSNFSPSTTQSHPDHALAYTLKDDKVEQVPYRNVPVVGPAGTIMSCPKEMANWLLLHLGKGKFGDKQIVSEANLNEMHTPQMVIPDTAETQRARKFAEIGPGSYGLGWFIETYRGWLTVHHGGNIDGFSNMVALLPEKNMGCCISTNLGGNMVPTIVRANLFDRFLGLDQIDWNTRAHDMYDEMMGMMKAMKEKMAADRVPDTKPSHPIEAYAGEYSHPGYGTVVVTAAGDELEVAFGTEKLKGGHFHYDRFDLRLAMLDMSIPATFGLGPDGGVHTLSIPIEQNVKPIVFTKIENKA
jgi:CubicO group peptidase (beta-lactamase class C family)